MIRLNGNDISGYDGITAEELVTKEGYTKERIALEINGQIISKVDYNQTILHSGDVVEVVSFVGGG